MLKGLCLWNCIKEDFFHLSSKHTRVEEDAFGPLAQFKADISVDDILVSLVDVFWKLCPVWSSLDVIKPFCDVTHRLCNLTATGHCSGIKWLCFLHLFVSSFLVSCDVSLHCIIECIGKVFTLCKAFEDFISFVLSWYTIVPTSGKLCWGSVISCRSFEGWWILLDGINEYFFVLSEEHTRIERYSLLPFTHEQLGISSQFYTVLGHNFLI